MATSSFFFNGSNPPDETQTQNPPSVTASTEDSVKTSFFYGSTPGPDQNTFNELVLELNEKVDEAEAAQVASTSAAASASNSAFLAEQSAQTSILAAQTASSAASSATIASQDAVEASTEALQQVSVAEGLLDQANAIISSFTISTSSPFGGEEGDVWFKVTL